MKIEPIDPYKVPPVGDSVRPITKAMCDKINELCNAHNASLHPVEEKCRKENGMLICYCGKCEPDYYGLPEDFGKPVEVGEKPELIVAKDEKLYKWEPKAQESWEKEFDKRFRPHPFLGDFTEAPIPHIKSFISSLLQQQKEGIVGKIKYFDITRGMLGKPVSNPLMRLEDVKNLIVEELQARKD